MVIKGSSVLVHSVVILLIFTIDYVFPPLAVVKIPPDSFLYSISELSFREPAKLIMYLSRIDSISHIVSLSVSNKCDKAFRLAECLAYHLDDIDISHLIVSAYIIDFTNRSLVDYQVDRPAVILYIKPVADILAFAIDGERFAMAYVIDEERN